MLSDDRRALFELPGAARESASGTNTAWSTAWRKDRRCENCMVHCGYEPTASLRPQRAARRHLEERSSSTSARNRSRPARATKSPPTTASPPATDISPGKNAPKSAAQSVVVAAMANPSAANLIALPRRCVGRSRRRSGRRTSELAEAIARAQENLLRQQHPDGHWCGELIVDSTLCSDYVLFMHWLGEVDDDAAATLRPAHSEAPAPRWRLEYLLRRPERE